MEKLDIDSWVKSYMLAVEEAFKDRIVFIGIQGSYARKEQSQTSDIDMVLILDRLCVNDVKLYEKAVNALYARELLCGFLSGVDELKNWEKFDLFQFIYDTIPLKGSLEQLKETVSADDVVRAIRIGACNIYHACVHNIFCEKSIDVIKALLKSAIFTLKAKIYYESGQYYRSVAELSNQAAGIDREVLELYLRSKKDGLEESELETASQVLLSWASSAIIKCNEM